MIRKSYGNMPAHNSRQRQRPLPGWITSVRSGCSRRDGIGAQEHAGARYCYVVTTQVCWFGSIVK